MNNAQSPIAQRLIAVALIALGTLPFISGAYETRSILWNGASAVLAIAGAIRLWMLLTGPKGPGPRR